MNDANRVKAIVAGFAAHFLYGIDAYGPIDNTRLVYAETLASVFVLIQIFFVTWGYKYPGCFRVDFPMSVAWIVAFALLVNQISPVHCGALLQLEYQSYGFYNCDQWKVMVTFAFASGMAALASGILV